jgi:hypothetical protein
VNPGLIDTQIARDVVSGDENAYADIARTVPIGRAGRPEEIASTVLWLCSPGGELRRRPGLHRRRRDDCAVIRRRSIPMAPRRLADRADTSQFRATGGRLDPGDRSRARPARAISELISGRRESAGCCACS